MIWYVGYKYRARFLIIFPRIPLEYAKLYAWFVINENHDKSSYRDDFSLPRRRGISRARRLNNRHKIVSFPDNSRAFLNSLRSFSRASVVLSTEYQSGQECTDAHDDNNGYVKKGECTTGCGNVRRLAKKRGLVWEIRESANFFFFFTQVYIYIWNGNREERLSRRRVDLI